MRTRQRTTMKPKPVVGETLIAVIPKRSYREREELRAEVIRVGRKYFTCRIGGAAQEFHLSTWARSGVNMQANFPIYLYRTEQEMRDKEEAVRLSRDLSDQLKYQSDWEKLSITQLRAIKHIIETPK